MQRWRICIAILRGGFDMSDEKPPMPPGLPPCHPCRLQKHYADALLRPGMPPMPPMDAPPAPPEMPPMPPMDAPPAPPEMPPMPQWMHHQHHLRCHLCHQWMRQLHQKCHNATNGCATRNTTNGCTTNTT